MDQAISAFQTALTKAFGAALGSAIVFAAVLALVLLLAMPVYLLLKRRGLGGLELGVERDNTLRFHDAEGQPGAGERSAGFGEQPAAVSQQPELIQKLDSVDRVVTTVYEYLIYLAIAGMTGAAAFLYFALPDDGNRDFLVFYGGVVYLLGMLWAIGQLFYVRRRRDRQADPRSIFSALSTLGSKINVTVESSPQTHFIDDAALERAQRHLDGGGTLEDACAGLDSRYREMNGIVKRLFEQAVAAALQHRRQAK